MKAAVYRNGKIVLDDVPDPRPGPGQLLVRTLACGICGSDLHFQHHAHQFIDVARRAGVASMAADPTRDIVLGHEFCCEVVESGAVGEKAPLKPGQIVCSPPLLLGANGARTIGYSHEIPGGFGEYMLLNEALMLPVPNGLPAPRAALTEPMAVGWHAVQLAGLRPEHVPLVIGCGPVGLAVIAALKYRNVRPIIAADLSAGRRDLARLMGADIAVDPAQISPYSAWSEPSVVGKSTTVATCLIFECVGIPGMLRQVMDGAPEGSDIIVVGACMEPDTIEPMTAMYKALTLKFSRTYTAQEFAEVLRLIAEGALNVEPLVSDVIGLDDVPAAFAALAKPGAQAKVMIAPWQ